MTLYILLGYLIVINSYAYILMGIDKSYARKQKRRVPEKQLFLVSAIGGAAGSWLGMRSFRHKTKHHSFTIGIPMLLLTNIIVIVAIAILIGGK